MASIAKFMRTVTPKPKLCRVTLVKSHLHAPPDIRKSVEALGLTRLNSSIIHKNISPIRGLINTAKFYVLVEDVAIPAELLNKSTKSTEAARQ